MQRGEHFGRWQRYFHRSGQVRVSGGPAVFRGTQARTASGDDPQEGTQVAKNAGKVELLHGPKL